MYRVNEWLDLSAWQLLHDDGALVIVLRVLVVVRDLISATLDVGHLVSLHIHHNLLQRSAFVRRDVELPPLTCVCVRAPSADVARIPLMSGCPSKSTVRRVIAT